MVELFIRFSAARHFSNVVLTYTVWIGLFNAVFLPLAWAFGLTDVLTWFEIALLGAAQCTPFLLIGMVMMRQLFKTRKALAKIAATDPLTNLPNRRAFLERLDQVFADQAPVSTLLLIDIDHFKRVNDSFGHPIGDVCLVAFGKKLADLRHQAAMVGRLGGEEFAILLENTPDAVIDDIAAQIIDGVHLLPPDVPEHLHLTCSIGAARAKDVTNCSDLLRQADAALYASKASGRGRLSWFDQAHPVEGGDATATGRRNRVS